ncbi:MAG TPA: MFS transporter [Alphaproteobacteria bacterium]
MSGSTATATPSRRLLALSYGTGLLSLGLVDAFVFIVPLWAVLIGASATEVGLLVGARAILPCLLTIHGGVLMDRFGPRRVMLAFGVVVIAIAPLYPAMPWFAPLFALQVVAGLALTMTWVGSQTAIAQLSAGETLYLGRYSFATRVGTFAAPIIFGLLWDLAAPWVSFACIAAWAAALLGLILALPDGATERVATDRPRLRALLPRLQDYGATLALLAIPAIAVTIGAGFLRNSTSGIQNSIYVVYLKEIGLTGTAIGILFATIEGASALGSLVAGPVARRFASFSLLVATTGLAIVLIAITPLLAGVMVLLLAVQLLRGAVQGINQPVMFSMQSKAVGRDRQGATVALRVTANRVAAIIVPPAMGVVADAAGIEASFLILGAVFLALTLLLWFYARTLSQPES